MRMHPNSDAYKGGFRSEATRTHAAAMALYLALYAPADKTTGPETLGTGNVKDKAKFFQTAIDLAQQELAELLKIKNQTDAQKNRIEQLKTQIAKEKAAKEKAAKEKAAAEKAAKEKAAKEKAAADAAAAEKAAKEKAAKEKAAAEKAAKDKAEKDKAATKAKKTKEDDQKELEASRNMPYSLQELTNLIKIQPEAGSFGLEKMKQVYTEFKDKIVDYHSSLEKKPGWDKLLWDKIIEFKDRDDVKTWLAIEKTVTPTVLRSKDDQDSIYKKYTGVEENKGYLYSDSDDFQGKFDFRTAFYSNNTKILKKEYYNDPRSWLHILLLRAHAKDIEPK